MKIEFDRYDILKITFILFPYGPSPISVKLSISPGKVSLENARIELLTLQMEQKFERGLG